MVIMVEQKEKYKIMVMAILLAGACFLTYYFHGIVEIGRVFTHFFYIPIILAALWWRRKGLAVATFLAALLIFSHIFVRAPPVTANDYLRALMFVVIAGVVAALSERIAKAQAKVTHLNLILRSIRNVNQLIAMEKNRDKLLKGACERLTETRGYHNVWIALLDESVGLVTTAEAGLGEDFLPMVERLKRGELPACGQRALSEPGIVVTQDPLSTCTDCPLAGKYDDRWAMTIRLEHGGKLYGLLCVSIPGELTADEEERALFKEVASDLAFALHSIEQEEERKKAEEELKKEKKFSENIITTVPDSLIVVDKDLRIKTANLSFYQVFQLDPEKVIGCHITDILGDEGEKLSTELNKLLGTKTSVENLELRYQSEKSGERIFSISARGIMVTEGEGEEEEEVLVVIGDITGRKHAEEALRESEEKYRTLSESLPDPVFEIDSAGKVIYLNRAALDTFGRSGEEILSGGVRLNNVIAESELEAARKNLGEIIKGKCHIGERTFVRTDGSRFVGEVHSGPLYVGARVIGARGVIRDITERKKMEEALRRFSEELELKVEERTKELKKERDYTRHLIESSLDFQLAVDKEGKIMDVNAAFESVIGKGRDIIIGSSIYEYLPKEETEKAIAEIFEKKKVRDIELTANIPEKGTLIWNVSGMVFTTPEREKGIYITGRDLTERRQMEEELKAKEMQLVHAGRLSSLGEMATGIAHEINQPLTVISMAAEGTLRDIEKKRVDMSVFPKDLEDIMSNVKRIDRIITHMRTFAREPGEIRAVKPEEVLDNAFILLAEQFKMHGILVSREIATNLPHIMVDSNQLEQVFINILTNARQTLDERREEAKKEGESFEKRLVCRISREREKEKEREWVVYEFADNAYGVPEELKMRVFEPFFTTKEIGEGTGLGLSIAYGIVTRSLRGKIWVEDNEAGGASFKVAMPVGNKELTTGLHKINTEERKK